MDLKRSDAPLVSLVIPCRNEEGHIGRCICSIIAQDYPKNRIEVLVVDGMSSDATRAEAQKHMGKGLDIRIIDNFKKITPAAMNLGVINSKGVLVAVIIAHAKLDSSFLSNAVRCLAESGADGAGGLLKPLITNKSPMAEAIILAVRSPFGGGEKKYLHGKKEGFITDTLPYCLYKRGTFEKFGMFEEKLVRGQDGEYNYRILRNGGKLYFSPKIKSYYEARTSLKRLWMQHFQYGYFNPYVFENIGTMIPWRRQIPLALVAALLVSGILAIFVHLGAYVFAGVLLAYLTANILFSVLISLRKGLKHLLFLPVVFATVHFSYGLGYLAGTFDYLLVRLDLKHMVTDKPLSR